MPSSSISLPFPEKLHEKRKPDVLRLPATFDLKFYEYYFPTFIL